MRISIQRWEIDEVFPETVFEISPDGGWVCLQPSTTPFSLQEALDVSETGALRVDVLSGDVDQWKIASELPATVVNGYGSIRVAETGEPSIDSIDKDLSPVVIIAGTYWMPFETLGTIWTPSATVGTTSVWLPVNAPDHGWGDFKTRRPLAEVTRESGGMTSGLTSWQFAEIDDDHLLVVIRPDLDPTQANFELRNGRSDDEMLDYFIDQVDWPSAQLALIRAEENGGSWSGWADDLDPSLKDPSDLKATIFI